MGQLATQTLILPRREIIAAQANTRVLVDADACPVIHETVKIATVRGFQVMLVGNDTQNLGRFANSEDVTLIEVPTARDSADFALALEVLSGDVVVTDDIGLASIVLSRGGRAISPRGHRFNSKTIDFELDLRHQGQRIRRSGKRTKGPSPFTSEDRTKFVRLLKRLLAET